MVVSAGSSVGARDETAGAVAALGEIWCHGLAVKPGKPTLLAECAGVPLLGLPGNPLSALVVFRLVGVPLVWRLAGAEQPPPEPAVRARLGRDLASATGRLDIVQVAVRDGVAEPLFGPVRAAVGAGPGRRLPGRPGAGDRPRRRHRGRGHPLPMTSPFVSDIPAEQARRAWREACAAAGCPPRVDAVLLPVGDAVGRVTAESVWARRSSPAFDSAAMDGIAVRAADTVGAAETTPVLLDDFEVVDTGDPLPTGYDAVVMREHVHHTAGRARRAARRRAARTSTSARSARTSAPPSCCCPKGHRLRPVDVAACAAAGVVELLVRRRPAGGDHPDRRRDPPDRHRAAPGEIARHQLADAGRAGRASSAARPGPPASSPTTRSDHRRGAGRPPSTPTW